MTWLYVPGTASSFVQASGDLDLACPSLSPSIAPSLTWRGKLMPPVSLSRAWKRATWMRRLSGLTLLPSTAYRGVAEFISSLPAIHASPIASPGNGAAQTMTASSSTKFCASSMSAGLFVSSGRTSRGMRTGNSPLSSAHWKQWVTALRLELSERRRLVRATFGNGSSSWPTVTVASRRINESPSPGAAERPTLDIAAETWPTPTAVNRVRDEETMAKCAAFRKRNANQNTVPLYLEEVALNWMTPLVADAGQKITHASHQKSLMVQAERDFQVLQALALTDYSLPDRPTPSGPKSSATRRRLNPRFVEWLMGWPIGWTSLEHAETGLSAWLLRMRGELSTPCTTNDAQQRLF